MIGNKRSFSLLGFRCEHDRIPNDYSPCPKALAREGKGNPLQLTPFGSGREGLFSRCTRAVSGGSGSYPVLFSSMARVTTVEGPNRTQDIGDRYSGASECRYVGRGVPIYRHSKNCC